MRRARPARRGVRVRRFRCRETGPAVEFPDAVLALLPRSRQRKGDDSGQVQHRVEGDACAVLTEALTWGATLLHIEGDVAHVLRW
ncbi:MAG: hypothetical protein ACRDSL_11010 [Pseudonocardiaceae bacterium]